MVKKKLNSGLVLEGIAPNILLQQIESTAPFLFSGEIDTAADNCAYLAKLKFYKKNLKILKHINLADYFYLCMAAHWTTAGTFVPTNVDNQIREGLWKNKDVSKHIEKMARITIASWKWDYAQVTNRKSLNPTNNQVLSTHEGTWLSVAIGAYCALIKNKKLELADEVAAVIWDEILKERNLLLELREKKEYIAFLKAVPLVAHNLGDLDRVMVQWEMNESDPFCQKIFKLGHHLRNRENKIFIFSGNVNKEFTSKENHRHMSMRQPKCLRRSANFLIPVGPFMSDWGVVLGKSDLLSTAEKAEIVAALFEGYKRQTQAYGYCRAYGAMIRSIAGGLRSLEGVLPFDIIAEIRKSDFTKIADISDLDFEKDYIEKVKNFTCPVTKMKMI